MKLSSIVVILAIYRNANEPGMRPSSDTDLHMANMTLYAYPPHLVPHMKGTMTLTYDLNILNEYLGPKPKILPQIWTLYGP